MAARKVYNLAVKTGEYTGRDGKKKNKWQNVGVVMTGQNDSGYYMMLDRTFNPAGVPNPDNRSTILVSMFEPHEQEGSRGGADRQTNGSAATGVAPHQNDIDGDEDIPF